MNFSVMSFKTLLIKWFLITHFTYTMIILIMNFSLMSFKQLIISFIYFSWGVQFQQVGKQNNQSTQKLLLCVRKFNVEIDENDDDSERSGGSKSLSSPQENCPQKSLQRNPQRSPQGIDFDRSQLFSCTTCKSKYMSEIALKQHSELCEYVSFPCNSRFLIKRPKYDLKNQKNLKRFDSSQRIQSKEYYWFQCKESIMSLKQSYQTVTLIVNHLMSFIWCRDPCIETYSKRTLFSKIESSLRIFLHYDVSNVMPVVEFQVQNSKPIDFCLKMEVFQRILWYLLTWNEGNSTKFGLITK